MISQRVAHIMGAFAWRIHDEIRYSLRRWAGALVAGGLLILLIQQRPSATHDLISYILCCGGHTRLLLLQLIITPGELAAARRAIFPAHEPADSAPSDACEPAAAQRPSQRPRMVGTMWKALRPEQWTKNLFVLMPIVFSHRLFSAPAVARAICAAVLFSLISSSSYLFNDIRDIEQDRVHPDKKFRPLAAGDLAPTGALKAWIMLLLLALLGGVLLRPAVAGILALYWALNMAYSLKLKHYVILDVILVTSGFILRIAAGAAAIQVAMSHWLLVCTALLALFLVLGKRKYELAILRQGAGGHRQALESYDPRILNFSIVAAGMAAFGSYSLYSIRQDIHPRFLVWTSPLVFFGIWRYIYLLFWKGLGGDPARILLTDFQLLAILLLWAGAVVGILYW